MNKNENSYLRFLLMILTSMIVMYCITYLNSYQIDHTHWSETRFYMTLLMGAAMAVIMLGFMKKMYKNSKINLAIFIGSGVIFTLALWLVRSQITVDDLSYMRAMIPHHSIAILTSERAGIKDNRVRKLADGIIETQIKEIEEMNWLIKDIEKNGISESAEERMYRKAHAFNDNSNFF